MVVDKLPHSLCVKWKEYRREKELKHATLLDFEKWIEMQAEVHDDFGIRTSEPPLTPPDHKFKHRGGSAIYSAVTASSGNSPRFNQSGPFTSPLCLMGDGKYHKLHSCPKFKSDFFYRPGDKRHKTEESNFEIFCPEIAHGMPIHFVYCFRLKVLFFFEKKNQNPHYPSLLKIGRNSNATWVYKKA